MALPFLSFPGFTLGCGGLFRDDFYHRVSDSFDYVKLSFGYGFVMCGFQNSKSPSS
jgi:hypothetical protein